MNADDLGADQRPPSDVSAAVGLAGLAALLVWLLICRNWGTISLTLGIGGPHEPMSGPYASVATLFVTGAAMSLWSLLVDKVHRNASTGIDWSLRRPLRESVDISITKLAGLWSTWAAIGMFYCLGRWYWDGQYLFAMETIAAAAPFIFLLSVPYVLWLDRRMIEPRDASWHFGALLIGREPWDGEQVKKHGRAWAIKGFFGAFMISILPGGFAFVVNADIGAVVHDPVALGSLLIQLLFLIDVQIGTVGYFFTFRPLDSHIRSGNPFLAAWVAALVCYPPIVWGTIARNDVMNYRVNTAEWAYWMQGHTALLWVWAALLVFLTGVYAWATFAFGLRFSNLTYRGVLTNGPYRFTRHPAYLSKNTFWWLSTMPFLTTSGSWVDIVRNTALLGIVSSIYFWRAKTEEAHLLSEDPKYAAYHGWMARNAPITRGLHGLWARFAPRPPQPQPQPQPAE